MMAIMMEISCDQYDEMLQQQDEDRKRIEELESAMREYITHDGDQQSTYRFWRQVFSDLLAPESPATTAR